MKILIIEDEPPVAEYISDCTQSILRNLISSIEIKYSIESAEEYLQKNAIDLCLLDLNLNGENGFEILKQHLSKPFQTIIISAYTEFAITAYEYGVIDFVSKTFDLDRLRTAFDRYLGRSERPYETKFMMVRKKSKNFLLPLEQIVLFEADRYLIKIIKLDGTIEYIEKPLNQLEIILPSHFWRVHRSYILNSKFIESFYHERSNRYYVDLKDGKSIPVSRKVYKNLKAKLGTIGPS